MSTSATEQLTAHIPRLDPEGANWATFAMHFKGAMIASRRWGYFDGSKDAQPQQTWTIQQTWKSR